MNSHRFCHISERQTVYPVKQIVLNIPFQGVITGQCGVAVHEVSFIDHEQATCR